MLWLCIKNENRKLRHSVIWLACFLLPILAAFMGVGNYLGNLVILKEGWYSLWTQVTLFYATFFYSPLIGLYAAYLWRLESFGHNWNTLMTMPVPVRDIFLGKLFVLCKISLITQVWMIALYLMGGKFSGLSGIAPGEILWWALRGLFAAFAIGAVQLLLSMIVRSFSVPIGIAFLGGIIGMLLPNKDPRLGLLWPYSLMLLGMNSNESTEVLSGLSTLFFLAVLVFFFTFLVLSVWILKRMDVEA